MKATIRSAARALVAACVLIGLTGPTRAASPAADTAPRSLAVASFELIEENPNPAVAADLARRLAAAETQMREGLTQLGLYRVAEAGTAKQTIEQLKKQHEYLYRCIDCAQVIGKAAKTDLVLMGWVQKVSELILNINVEVRDTATNNVILAKSVDLRGNNDESWTRGVKFMLRDWAERRQRNPKYGQ